MTSNLVHHDPYISNHHFISKPGLGKWTVRVEVLVVRPTNYIECFASQFSFEPDISV